MTRSSGFHASTEPKDNGKSVLIGEPTAGPRDWPNHLPFSDSLRVAVVHEWFVNYAGSERVLEQLIAEHKCNQCHTQKWTDDGKAIYRPKGRVNTPALLQGMVERCSTQLNLSLFPEEVTAMAAVLNRDHYRFTQ